MIKNPYQILYNEIVQIRQNMSNQQYSDLAKQLGLLHNTLGKAISDIIQVLGATILKNQQSKQKEPTKHSQRQKIQQENFTNCVQNQLQKFQYPKSSNNKNFSYTLSNSQTCSLENKSINGNNRNLTQQLQFQSFEKLRLNYKLNSNKSFQEIFKQSKKDKAQTQNTNKIKNNFDVYNFSHKSQASQYFSDIEQSSKKKPVQSIYQKPYQNFYDFCSQKKQKNKGQFKKNQIQFQKKQEKRENKTPNYDFLKNKQVNKSDLQINQKNYSNPNQSIFNRNKLEYQKQSQDSQQMIIRQQKLKKYDPNATFRLVGVKKADKQGMKGITCPNCEEYYKVLGVNFIDICDCSSRHRSNADAPIIKRKKKLQLDI